jgi:phosphomethylpyrimidine synthase
VGHGDDRRRRTLNWEKQIALSIDPEEASRIHARSGQLKGNTVPCTMCGGACVYIILPQQRFTTTEVEKLQQTS